MKVDLPIVQDQDTVAKITFKPKAFPDFDAGGTPAANLYSYFKAMLSAIYAAVPEQEALGVDGRKFQAKLAVAPAAMFLVQKPCSWTITFKADRIESEGEVPIQAVAAFMLAWCGWVDEELSKRNKKPVE